MKVTIIIEDEELKCMKNDTVRAMAPVLPPALLPFQLLAPVLPLPLPLLLQLPIHSRICWLLSRTSTEPT